MAPTVMALVMAWICAEKAGAPRMQAAQCMRLIAWLEKNSFYFNVGIWQISDIRINKCLTQEQRFPATEQIGPSAADAAQVGGIRGYSISY
jgi:hypothetical protein